VGDHVFAPVLKGCHGFGYPSLEAGALPCYFPGRCCGNICIFGAITREKGEGMFDCAVDNEEKSFYTPANQDGTIADHHQKKVSRYDSTGYRSRRRFNYYGGRQGQSDERV
jgi:hypothetical protein